MADTKISGLTDGGAAVITDRIPVARSPFAAGDNRYLTPVAIRELDLPETGSLTVATGRYHLTGVRYSLASTQRLTLAGTARLRLQN